MAGRDLTRGADPAGPPVTAELLPVRSSGDVDELPGTRIGEVVTLDDARFSDEAARVGLWRPVEFLEDYGAGIYFLEPYHPNRPSLLFVHAPLAPPANF